MRLMRLILPIALGMILLLAVGARAADTTRAEYTARVEPICKTNTKVNERILKGVRQEVRHNRLRPAAAKFARAATALKKTLHQLQHVPPPRADKARIEKWLADIKVESRLFATAAKKLKAGQKGKAAHMVALLTSNANKTNTEVLPFEFHYCRFEPSKFT